MWDSVELYNLNSQHGGYKHSRRTLIRILANCFRDEDVLLSFLSSASILVFKKCCHFVLQNTEDREGKILRTIAEAIKIESYDTDRNYCKGQVNLDIATQCFSNTLTVLL